MEDTVATPVAEDVGDPDPVPLIVDVPLLVVTEVGVLEGVREDVGVQLGVPVSVLVGEGDPVPVRLDDNVGAGVFDPVRLPVAV